MKSLFLAMAAVAISATSASAYTPCHAIVAPQPTSTVLAKKSYQPVVSVTKNVETASSVKPTFGRRPVVKQSTNARRATELTVGATVTAPARFLGNEVGCVFLQVGPAMLECDVVEWCPTSVTFIVPNMGLGPITPGRLQIVRGDGDIIRDYPVCLIRKPDLIVHEAPAPKPATTVQQVINALPQS